MKAKLGSDPFDLKPLRRVEDRKIKKDKNDKKDKTNKKEKGHLMRGGKLPPCQIFSALQDDYIPSSHGSEMQRAWQESGAPCSLVKFPGRHFGERSAGLLLGAAEKIRAVLSYDKQREEEAALRRGLASLSLNSSGGSGMGLGKIPWAGVW